MPIDINNPPRLAYPSPRVRKSEERRAISFDGNCAINTEISSTMVHSRAACSKPATPKPPSTPWNAIRFKDARLQAVSSRKLYSEHGLDALIRPLSGQVCHSLIVVSNCSPGSAEAQAAWPMRSHSSRAGNFLARLPSVRRTRFHGRSAPTHSRKWLETLTELFEFCPATVRYASESQSVS